MLRGCFSRTFLEVGKWSSIGDIKQFRTFSFVEALGVTLTRALSLLRLVSASRKEALFVLFA